MREHQYLCLEISPAIGITRACPPRLMEFVQPLSSLLTCVFKSKAQLAKPSFTEFDNYMFVLILFMLF